MGRLDAAQPPYVVVIDPGHGGKDTGACAFGRQEKEINLAVSLLTKDCIRELHPEVQVYMTRTTDVFVGLQERAAYANKKKADLFISIHTNSAASSSASGTETFVLGLWRAQDNLDVARRENQAILLEDNYRERYEGFDPNSTESYIIFEMMQDVHLQSSIDVAREVQRAFSRIGRGDRSVQQAGFLVLRETSMPSILVELGFISNKNESDYLAGRTGRKQLAQSIARGFSEYYKKYLASTQPAAKQRPPAPKAGKASPQAPAAGEHYRVQIAASRTELAVTDAQFRYADEVCREQRGSMYLYTAGRYDSLEEARRAAKELSRHYPGCYIVFYRGGERIREIY